MVDKDKLIGGRLHQCRKAEDMTLEQVADRIGAGVQQLNNWERGIRPVSVSFLHELSALFNKSFGWLGGGSDQAASAKGPVITINDDLMAGDLKKGDEVEIDLSKTEPQTADMFAIKVNNQSWVRWIRPAIDGSYTISAVDSQHCPDIRVENLAELKKLDIIGRVHCVKRPL